MVKLRFIVKDGTLVLRFSEGKERIYRVATQILIGKPNVQKHWDNEKERFTRVAVSYRENNQALSAYKSKYAQIIASNPGLSVKQVADYCDTPVTTQIKVEGDVFVDFLGKVIEREKMKKGCNFENYYKLLMKIQKCIPELLSLTLQELTYDKCVEVSNMFAKQKGYFGYMKAFMNTLGKANKDRAVKFSISQVEGFRFQDYNPDKDRVKTKKPDVLTPEQLKEFFNIDLDSLDYPRRERSELFHDFSVFMLHTMMAPCDVIKLKVSDITPRNTISTCRKKTHRPVEVPITPIMRAIIDKYSGMSKDGYIFPIIDDDKESKYLTRDYSFKKFREALNIWLKVVGKRLGVEFPLYAYVFRHTAITLAIDNGLPIAYVSAVAGTGIDMIQNHYYNSDSSVNSSKLEDMFMQASRR